MLPLLAFASLQGSGLATPEPAFRRPAQDVQGDKSVKILFIRARYADDDPSLVPYTPDYLDWVAKSLDHYFRRQSYGLFSVGSHEVTQLVRLDTKASYVDAKAGGHKPLERDAIDAINLATNRKVGQLFDFICIMAKKPGNRNFAFSNSQLAFFPRAGGGAGAFFHELGHCMGFGHSNALVSEVPGETLPPRDSRYIIEYGDHASAMGAVEIWAYSLIERYQMGWIGNSDKYPRYIKKFDWGETSFVSHDLESPQGLVGGYVEGRFGITGQEYNRDKAKRVHLHDEDQAVQRLWFSLITHDGDSGGFKEFPRPFILAHVTGTVRGGAKPDTSWLEHRSTVLLDLTPTGDDGRNLHPQSKGLFEGQSATIRQVDGSAIRVKFVSYDKATFRATLDVRLVPAGSSARQGVKNRQPLRHVNGLA